MSMEWTSLVWKNSRLGGWYMLYLLALADEAGPDGEVPESRIAQVGEKARLYWKPSIDAIEAECIGFGMLRIEEDGTRVLCFKEQTP